MKTTKGGKVMNPTDAYRKELRKKELKRVTRIDDTFFVDFPRFFCYVPYCFHLIVDYLVFSTLLNA